MIRFLDLLRDGLGDFLYSFRDAFSCFIFWGTFLMTQWFQGGTVKVRSLLSDDNILLYFILTLIWTRLVIISWDRTIDKEVAKKRSKF